MNNNTASTQFCMPMGGGMNMMHHTHPLSRLLSSSDDGSHGMIMYMDGFHLSLKGGSELPCLNLYFSSWTLDTRGKFIGAMIFILILAFLTEGMSKLRYHINNISDNDNDDDEINNDNRNNNTDNINAAATPSISPPRIAPIITTMNNFCSKNTHVIISILHTAQALAGYVLMLAGMTFSLELLSCAICGLGIGYGYFFASSMNDIELESHITTNPCCNYMQEEVNDNQQHQQQQQKRQQQRDRMLNNENNNGPTTSRTLSEGEEQQPNQSNTDTNTTV